MRILNTILNTIFPVNCIICGKEGSSLCAKCLLACPVTERESVEWVFPKFDYRHPPIKKAIWLLKYKGKREFADIFADMLYQDIIEELSDQKQLNNFTNPILIPIPLARKRLCERGYNQAALLCRRLIKHDCGKTFCLREDILYKPKDTIHQARIEDKRKRIQNIKGTFEVNNIELVKGRNIILIDDVTTTGATLSEARRVLREVGARKIIAFTIAH